MSDLTGALGLVGAVAAVCCLAKVWFVRREWQARLGHVRRGRIDLDDHGATRHGNA